MVQAGLPRIVTSPKARWPSPLTAVRAPKLTVPEVAAISVAVSVSKAAPSSEPGP
jgi:hypothetical protein